MMAVTQLRIVNDCLAIMGEAPLNSLNEDHEFKGIATTLLNAESERIQSQGWWFNTESLKLAVNPIDLRIYLPNDAGATVTFDRRPDLAQRGRVIYDLENGTDRFELGTELSSRLIRVLPIDTVPTSVAEYIAASTLLAFQNDYDGDQTKTRNLIIKVDDRKLYATQEHIRNRKVNLLDRSYGLSRIRNIVRQARRYA